MIVIRAGITLVAKRSIRSRDQGHTGHGELPGQLERLLGHRVGELRRNDDDALLVAHDDVARVYGHVRTADRNVDFDRVQPSKARSRHGPLLKCREPEARDLRRIAKDPDARMFPLVRMADGTAGSNT